MSTRRFVKGMASPMPQIADNPGLYQDMPSPEQIADKPRFVSGHGFSHAAKGSEGCGFSR